MAIPNKPVLAAGYEVCAWPEKIPQICQFGAIRQCFICILQDISGEIMLVAFVVFVITVDEETAGFVSVDDEVNYPDTNHNIGYLFIARGFRRKGIAKSVVNKLLTHFSGGWQIFHITENLGAAVFWKNVIPKLTLDKFTVHNENIDGYACILYKFISP
jgi:predicted acetyltransferase